MRVKGQMIAFGLIYTAYVAYYIAQKNYAFWLQALIDKEDWKAEDVGAFGSAFQISSGASKLLNGPFVDSMSPTVALAGSLAVIGVCNGLMFRIPAFSINISLWAINGVFQGVGWPALARIFIAWFPDKTTRGTWYSLLSTNQNVGSTLVPLLMPTLMSFGGWKAALWIPCGVSLAMSLVLFALLKDQPEANDDSEMKSKSSGGQGDAGGSQVKDTTKGKESEDISAEDEKMDFYMTCFRLTLLGAAYFFISIIRQGIGDWSTVALKEEKGFTTSQTSSCLVMLEVGAFIGGLAGGVASDRFFKGRRGPVMCVFSFLCIPLIYLAFIEVNILSTLDPTMVTSGLYALIGFCSFAPHVLIGLFARELAPKYASTAGGFVKALGQLGGSFAGAPLSKVVSSYPEGGWKVAATIW
eukprot:CAMPEP_0114525640 /NCGR_PEP_ID=MMETSP0109-20121206/22545_1 /TAXON_ID=29199 /ORGANISM="Chlorarachnion reptans, Strain CCCM449" /LENGTH=411 /DNA_ID=CAMNT_0001707261 /DNA_START=108 /DNA_END=1340 /DNA_ORIENTATION=+